MIEVSGLPSPGYTASVGSLRGPMQEFAPSVIVRRDGVVLEVPMERFWAMQEKKTPEEAAA